MHKSLKDTTNTVFAYNSTRLGKTTTASQKKQSDYYENATQQNIEYSGMGYSTPSVKDQTMVRGSPEFGIVKAFDDSKMDMTSPHLKTHLIMSANDKESELSFATQKLEKRESSDEEEPIVALEAVNCWQV